MVSTQGSSSNSLETSKLQLFELLEKYSGLGIFEWVLSSDYIRCSDNFFDITGLKADTELNEITTEQFLSIISPKQRNYVFDVIQANLVQLEPFELTFDTSSDPPKQLKLSGYLSGDIRTTRLLGLIQDVTLQQSIEETMIRGQEKERKRISMELHDGVGQKLIATKHLASMYEISKDQKHLDKLKEALDDVIKEIRGITHDLSAEVVSKYGLIDALTRFIENCQENTNIEFGFAYDVEQDLKLALPIKKSIYRIIQEAVSNILKHADCTKVMINIRQINQQLMIDVSDDGCGFDVTETMVSSKGIGLQNIRTRVTDMNGFFQIDSQPTKGTILHIKIPYSHELKD